MSKNNSRILLPVIAVLVLLLLVAWIAGYFTSKIEPGVAPQANINDHDTVPVVLQTAAFSEPVPASVAAKQATIISSRLLARITAIKVRAGDYVDQGELLIELEKTDLLARSQQASERIKVVQARLKEAQQALERAQELRQRGLVAQANLDAANANASALEAELASARQSRQETETAVSFTDIQSPLAGRVVDRFAEPGDTASPGQKLLSLYNPFSLRVEAQVREGLALSLETGKQLAVDVPSLEQSFIATIEEIVPAADPGSRSFLVKAILPSNPSLLPGMYARVQIPAGERQRLLIPADRVARVGQLDVVWVYEQGVVDRRFVRLGPAVAGDYIEVISGLELGERLLPVP